MIILQFVAFGSIALILTFLLGYIILHAVTSLTVKECVALAGACGIALQGLIAFIGFLLGLSGRGFFLLATLGLFSIAIALLLRRPTRSEPNKNKSWLYLLIMFWVILMCIQLLVPIYGGAYWFGDWWMHYDIAQVYLGKQSISTIYFEIYTVTSRTPLFNLFSSYYLGLLENQFSVYQLSSILPGVFLLAMIPLLVRPDQVTLAIILIAFNPYMNNMMIYPWPKILACLYIITGIYFYLDIRKSSGLILSSQSVIGCGLSWGLAILSHPSTVLYVIAMIADNIWINRSSFINILRQLLFPLLLTVGVLLPWILWGINTYGSTNFFLALSKTTGSATIVDKVLDALKNAEATVIPYPLLINLKNIVFYKDHLVGQGIWNSWLRLGNSWLRFYYDVLPGSLTITISYLLIRKGAKQYLRKNQCQSILPDSLFWTIIVIGFFGGCLLQPGLNLGGIVGESMTPIIFLLLLVATEYLSVLPIKLKQVVLLMVSGEFLISRGFNLVLLTMKHPFILMDDNVNLKMHHNLVFARDVIGSPWPALMVAILFLILLAIGLKGSLTKIY